MRLIFAILLLAICTCSRGQADIFVRENGKEKRKYSLKYLNGAVEAALKLRNRDVIIRLRKGVYHLDRTIEIHSSACKSLTITSYQNQEVTISGTQLIQPNWEKGKIWQAHIDLQKAPDRLFMNSRSLPMARYPNYDSSAAIFHGTSSDAIKTTWKDPTGGYIHALHKGEWGGFHYRITGKDDTGKLILDGGWQNNRPAPMHPKYRFVENIFEELDAPGEWFYDHQKKILFVYPPTDMDMRKELFEVSRLDELIVIKDSKNISISGIRFTGTNRTFMLTKEPLLRSDWTIFRGGAIMLDKTENISISDNQFSNLGGNAIFVSNYNRHANITGNLIENIGGSAIAFVGNPDAVRSPAFNYNQNIKWDEMDYQPGPKSPNYPAHCTASNNLIHDIGTIEKQVAGIEISMSSEIVFSHNTIYNVPRAGINIGDGCWGGHTIEFNDVFNTVLETGDHGAFNSWGRDRFWRPDRKQIDSIVAAKPGIELLDVIKPITLRNNRFQCDHGWDIDLDDGSSNYQIYNNVCLSGGLKLREGYHRTVTNNIIINNTFHPHVWLKNSDDVFSHNIVTSAYAPIQINDWGKQVDSNFFLSEDGLRKAQGFDVDQHSIWGDAMFVDAASGNYRVGLLSPALEMGFRSFAMNFGVSSYLLKERAARPVINALNVQSGHTKGKTISWLGATCKNIETLGERSAAGLNDLNGALIVTISRGSVASKNHLLEGDVIIMLAGEKIKSTVGLVQSYQANKWKGKIDCVIFRNQQSLKLKISFKD